MDALKEDFKDKVLADLKESGFASEMKAIHNFKDAGWQTSAGVSYFDLDRSTTRSVDIGGHIIEVSDKADCEYHIFAEVKKTQTPWIVFRTPHRFLRHTLSNPIVEWEVTTEQKGMIVDAFAMNTITKRTVGYGVHEFKKPPNDEGRWYAAAVTVAKMCYGYPRHQAFSSNGLRLREKSLLVITHPVVVLDGLLISAELDRKGETHLTPIKYCSMNFEFGTEAYAQQNYRIDLVTSEGLPEFLGIMKERAKDTFAVVCQ